MFEGGAPDARVEFVIATVDDGFAPGAGEAPAHGNDFVGVEEDGCLVGGSEKAEMGFEADQFGGEAILGGYGAELVGRAHGWRWMMGDCGGDRGGRPVWGGLFFGFAFAEPFGFGAGFAGGGVVFEAGGDGLGLGKVFVLEDEPFAGFDDGDEEAFGAFCDFEFGGVVAVAGDGGEGLLGHGDGFHVFVEQGDLEFVASDGDFAMHGFVFAELEDAAFVGAEFDAAVGEEEAGGGGEQQGGDEVGFHWVRGLSGLGLVYWAAGV